MGTTTICEKCNSKGYGRCVCENAPSSCTTDSFVRCIACDGRGMFHSKKAGAYEAICARCHGTGEEPNKP